MQQLGVAVLKSSKGKKIIAIAAVILVALAVAGVIRSRRKTPYRSSSVSMGTVVSESLYSRSGKAAEKAIAEINRSINELDRKDLSWRVKGSDVYRLNHEGSCKVSPETAECIKYSLEIAAASGGKFDPTIGKVTTLWNIGTEDARVPEEREIAEALTYVAPAKVKVSGDTVSIGKGQFLDLGATGKGLACDRAKEILSGSKVTGGIVSVGGSLLIYGKNPVTKDGQWLTGVRNPFAGENDYALTVKTGEAFISTSGDYEKVFEKDGKKYHHIIDPYTGYPAEIDVSGVTVIAKTGFLSDALSTACFITGYNKDSLSLLEKYGAEAVFIMKDRKVYATDGIRDSIKITDSSFRWGEEKQ